jgi:hypothetical protein
MKTLTRWLLTLVLAAVPMMAVINTASANTELVPASRLVAPYLAVSASKSTFLLLTNWSAAVNLMGAQTPGAPAAFYSVHLEFYNKNCDRTDRSIHLSPTDIDQVNVVSSDIAGGFTEAFLDLDVRTAVTGAGSDLPSSSSAQRNVLMGEVVITDTASDYTLSYPMASILGSAAGAAPFTIVTRDAASALANVWTGRYEPLPTTIEVPGYYAEGGTALAAGTVTESLLAVASPADGNWYGTSGTCVATGCGEAPGQLLATAPAPAFQLIKMPSITVYDGCEHFVSRFWNGHYMFGSLTALFGTLLDRNGLPSPPGPWSAANCTAGTFPGLDELSGVPVGWIDLPNTSCVRSANFNFAQINACSAGGAATATVAKIRGVAGIFLEAAVVTGGAATTRGADVARLWGDRSTITAQTGCTDSVGAAVLACKYNIENAIGTIPVSQP